MNDRCRTVQTRRTLLAVAGVTLALVVAASGCTELEPQLGDEVAVARAALGSSYASQLAQPELDLHIDAPSSWLVDASKAAIDARIATGERLFRLDVTTVSPLRYTALFIPNTGYFERTGAGWAEARTQSQLQAIAADPARRIVDLAPYVDGNGTVRFGVVWLGNTGSQQRQWNAVTNAASVDAVVTAAAGMRITSLDGYVIGSGVGATMRYAAVMIGNSGADARTQWVGTAPIADIHALLEANNARLIGLEEAVTGSYSYVAENLRGERGWWFEGLTSFGPLHTDPAALEHFDNLADVEVRLGARYTELKHHTILGRPRYMAVLTKTKALPQRGPSHGGNLVLAAIDAVMHEALAKFGLTGASLAITQGGRLVYAQGYGNSHLSLDGVTMAQEPTLPARLGSVTKTIALLAYAQLVNEGAVAPVSGNPLSFDTRPFGEVWPTDPELANLTVRDLLSHRSGLNDTLVGGTNDRNFDPGQPGLSAYTTPNNILNPSLLGDFLWVYQNGNYTLLGQIIEDVSGETFEDFVQSRILDPLEATRVWPTLPRSSAFLTGWESSQETPGYGGVGESNRRGGAVESGDGVRDYLAAGAYAASVIDILRLWTDGQGLRAGPHLIGALYQSHLEPNETPLPRGW